MLEGKGKFVNRLTKTLSGDYDRFFVYIPVEVARDSAFPFAPDDVVKVKIDKLKKRIIIERD
jgi:hypothetical protein